MDRATLISGLLCFGPLAALFVGVWAVFVVAAAGVWKPVASRAGLKLEIMLPWRRQQLVGTLQGRPVRVFLERRAQRNEAWGAGHTSRARAAATMVGSRALLSAELELPGFADRFAETLERYPFTTLENRRLILRSNSSAWSAEALEALLEEAAILATLITTPRETS
jgi:hypothetical protein